MTDDLVLRDVMLDDLPLFFRQTWDPEPDEQAAFSAWDQRGHDDFSSHWHLMCADPSLVVKTIVFCGQVAGSVMSYQESGRSEVSYWLGERYWGQGIATRALRHFLAQVHTARPIYARATTDNVASIRVLQKCGFDMDSQDPSFIMAPEADMDEVILVLGGDQIP